MAGKTKAANAGHADAIELTLREYQLLAEFRYLLARFLAFSEKAAQEAGLSPRQHQSLLAIKGYPGGTEVTVGDLA
ncbi:MAG: MarR family transcriptional regulator, partial [Pseudomonadota bacterium]|nr:MarR family transcriptional regulator [Pseudomonadota bacterium]